MKNRSVEYWCFELSNLKIDGIRHIARAKHKLSRLFWSMIFLISACVCIFLIVSSINEFQRFEVVTISRLLQEEKSVFPSVTICNINPFTTDYSVSLVKKANISFSENYQTIMLAMENYFMSTTGRYMSNAEKRKLSDLNMVLNYCVFNNAKCYSSWFEWIWHPVYYGCYRFNSGRDLSGQPVNLLKSNVAGSSFRFVVDLYTGLPNEWNSAGQERQRGFYALIQNASDYPYGSIPSPFFATPSFGAKIAVKREFYNQYNAWPYTYSRCRVSENNELMDPASLDDRYLFDQVVAAGNYSYLRATCLFFCIQTVLIVKSCNCTHNFLRMRVPNVAVCMTLEKHQCAENVFRQSFFNRTLLKQSCSPKCPIECNRRVFQSSISYFKYPVKDQAIALNEEKGHTLLGTLLANQTDFSDVQNIYVNMATISVYYDRLSYEVNEEQPAITIANLIGSIGGHLHLFLGMSLLSIVEVLDMVASGVEMRVKQKKKKNTYSVSSTQRHPSNSTHEFESKTKDLGMDGLSNIFKTDICALKMLWMFLFLFSVSGCAFFIVDSIRDFLNFQVTTDTRMEPNQPNTLFPSITICHKFPITTEYGAQLYSRALPSSIVSSTTQAMALLESYSKNTTGAYMSDEQLKLLSELVIVSCQIGDRACNSSDFQWMWIPRYYGCYRFNAGFNAENKPRELIKVGTSLIGSSVAFSIELYSGLPDFLMEKQAQYSQRGFYIFLQNSTDYPFNLTPSPTIITPGFGVEMLVERSFYSQFNEWPYLYSECRVDENNQLIGSPIDDRYMYTFEVRFFKAFLDFIF